MKALEQNEGDVMLLSTGDYVGWTTEEIAGDYVCEGEVVTIPWGGTVKGMKYYKGKFVTADNRIATSADTSVLNNKFLYYLFLHYSDVIQSFYRGAGIQHPNMNDVLHIELPVPPMEEQERIVGILDKFEALVNDLTQGLPAEIEARREQYEYYRNKLLTFKVLA
jgi:type I restriction enzyme S subunit